MIVVQNQKDNIWTENPHLELISEFAKFKKEVGSVKSSKVLTALFLAYSPKSPLRNHGMSEDEILEDVTTNYLTYKDFDWSDYDDIKEIFLEKTITKIDKLFLQYERDLEELNAVMKSWKYTKENAKERAGLMREYKNHLEDFLVLKNKVEEEKKTNINRAGYRDSLTEQLVAG